MQINLIIPGPPVPQLRARFTTRGGHGRAYDPPKCEAHKWVIAQLAREAMAGLEPMAGPVGCELSFHFERKSRDKKTDLWRAKKPDIDNLAKIVWDSCGINTKKPQLSGGIYRDDNQIVCVTLQKVFTDSEPRTEALFWTMK